MQVYQLLSMPASLVPPLTRHPLFVNKGSRKGTALVHEPALVWKSIKGFEGFAKGHYTSRQEIQEVYAAAGEGVPSLNPRPQ